MIILFVVDTSASMNQKYSNGFSLLDCAKNGVEHLVKVANSFGFPISNRSFEISLSPATHTHLDENEGYGQ